MKAIQLGPSSLAIAEQVMNAGRANLSATAEPRDWTGVVRLDG